MATTTPVSNNRNLLAVLFLGVLMGALDIAIVGPALPALQRAFTIGERAGAWIFAIYVLTNLISTPIMAKLSDMFGRRAIYVLDVVLFAVGSLVVALAPTFAVLLVGRAIQGFGSGGIFPVASAVIGDIFPPEKRGRALGMIGAVFGIAFLLGPIIGGVLLLLSWQWLFLINLPLAALVIVLSMRVLPSRRVAKQRPFDLLGTVILTILLICLTVAVNQFDSANATASLQSMNVLPFLLGALVLLPIFVLLEQRAADPLLRLRLLRSRQVALATALAAGAGLAEAAVVFVPTLLVAAFKVTTSTASFMLVPIVIAMAIGSPFSGRMLDAFGSRVVVLGGTALMAVGLMLVAVVGNSVALFYLSAVLFGLGLSVLIGAALRYIMLNEAPASERASAQGLLTIFTNAGQLFGGVFVGAIAASWGGGVPGYSAAFLVLGVIMAVLMVLSFGLKSRAAEQATVQRNEQPDVPGYAAPDAL